jgi:hypothetical protein
MLGDYYFMIPRCPVYGTEAYICQLKESTASGTQTVWEPIGLNLGWGWSKSLG